MRFRSNVHAQGALNEPKNRERSQPDSGKGPATQRAVQKAAMVRRHLADKVPVSDLADEYHLPPSLIYLWVKQVLDPRPRQRPT